jgi:hypothetical protein
MMAAIRRVEPAPWTPARAWRTFIQQTAIQPAGLVLIPLCAILAIPFAWMHALFQNATILGDGDEAGVTALLAKSWKQATYWPKQNHIGIWLLSPWMLFLGLGFFIIMISVLNATMPPMLQYLIIVMIFSSALTAIGITSPIGFLIAGNIAALLLFFPWAAHHWFGWRTTFSLAGAHGILNTTFLLTVFAITYLILDPLMKTFYVLRCFYGESRHTGEDLRVDLRTIASRIAIVLFISFALFAPSPQPATAKDSGGTARSGESKTSNDWKKDSAKFPTTGIPPAKLDTAIDEVLKRPIYQWRLPQPKADEIAKEKNFARKFFTEVARILKKCAQWVSDTMYKIERWIRHWWNPKYNETTNSGGGGPSPSFWVYLLVFSLIALVIIAIILLFKRWKAAKSAGLAAQKTAVATAPDIHDENVLANQLPADEWIALARELIAKGEFRAALRALFLASLALLAQQHLVVIARGKSNYDYLRELDRRAHALPRIPEIFNDNVLAFERVWYGRDIADSALVTELEQHLRSLREMVAPANSASSPQELPHA